MQQYVFEQTEANLLQLHACVESDQDRLALQDALAGLRRLSLFTASTGSPIQGPAVTANSARAGDGRMSVAKSARLTHVCTPSGTRVDLKLSLAGTDTVNDLRCHTAVAMQVGIKQVRLMVGNEELADGQTIANAVGGDMADVAVTAVPLSPEVYKPHIIADPRSWTHVNKVSFPKPQGISINMMPFRISSMTSIPEEYIGYWPIIQMCAGHQDEVKNDAVWFLTINESIIEPGHCQRRGGLHIEAPGVVLSEKAKYVVTSETFGGRLGRGIHAVAGQEVKSGLYMASNVADSCMVWHAQIKDHMEVAGPGGDLEHMRAMLPPGEMLQAGELVWLTDLTPHESLPLKSGAYRQFIRVITGSVSKWWEKHSTKNRLGTVPDPAVTQIISHSKFDASDI